MSDDAVVNLQARILPDEIGKLLTGLASKYSPADATEGWYFKITDVTTSNTNLISEESYTSKGGAARGEDAGTAMSYVSLADKVKFLIVVHSGYRDDGSTSSTESIYLTISGATAAHNGTDSIEIGPREAWFVKMNNTTVADINCIVGQSAGAGTGSNKVQCIVAAVLDDV